MSALWRGRRALGLTAVESRGIILPGADARPAPGRRRRCGNLHRTEHRMPPGLFRIEHAQGRPTRVSEDVASADPCPSRPGTLARTRRHRVRFRRAFAWVSGRLADGDTVSVMGLRCGGSAARWGFAIHLASKDGYEDAILPTGDLSGTREDAPDTARGPTSETPPAGPEPPTNVRGDHRRWFSRFRQRGAP